jgi:toxin CptA
LNIYSCGLCAQTVDWQVDRRKLSYGVGVVAFAFTIYLILRSNFAASLDGWLAGLVTWVAPWAAIMLVHYYWVVREEIDVEALFQPPRQSRIIDVSWRATIAFVVGMVVTWACEYGIPSYLQGPIAKAAGGVDLSWLAGAVVGGVLYAALVPSRDVAPVMVPAPEPA